MKIIMTILCHSRVSAIMGQMLRFDCSVPKKAHNTGLYSIEEKLDNAGANFFCIVIERYVKAEREPKLFGLTKGTFGMYQHCLMILSNDFRLVPDKIFSNPICAILSN